MNLMPLNVLFWAEDLLTKAKHCAGIEAIVRGSIRLIAVERPSPDWSKVSSLST
jgi:hypothetical protein